MKKKLKQILFGKNNNIKKILFGKPKGILMHIDTENKVQRLLGIDEKEIQSAFAGFSKKCDYFFDIGSSDAYYGLFYKKFNPKGELYMFDAEAGFEKVQKEHLEINNIKTGVHLFYKYVSDINDEKNISVDTFNIKNSTVLFKIDVEGAELKVLEGITGMLENNNCSLIIETHAKQLEIDCIEFLRKKGYRFKIIEQAWWRAILPELRPLEHNRWLEAYR